MTSNFGVGSPTVGKNAPQVVEIVVSGSSTPLFTRLQFTFYVTEAVLLSGFLNFSSRIEPVGAFPTEEAQV